MEENIKAEENETTTANEEIDETVVDTPEEPATDTEASTDTAVAEEEDPLAQALAQIEDYKNSLQRERADFQNYRKRTEREIEMMRSKISGNVLAKVLPVIDDFERALEAVPDAEKESDWMAGITLIYRKLQNLMDAEGVKAISPLGEAFDPTFHEAIGADEPNDEYSSGQVTAVLQKGYVKGDVVLRPAIVRVAN